MNSPVLSLDIRKIVTDSDLDGIVTAAILKRHWRDAEIIFAHPGELRSGVLDGLIDKYTAICDLPMHPRCGLNIDHHWTNKIIDDSQTNGIFIWKDYPSAARIAYEILSEVVDLSDLEELLFWVDKIDSGHIKKEEFLENGDVFVIGRLIGSNQIINLQILEAIKNRESIKNILSKNIMQPHLKNIKDERIMIDSLIDKTLEVNNRLAIVRFEDSGIRSNGYHITAKVGDDCDACIIIHGYTNSKFNNNGEYPVSASFYTNSFLHTTGGIYNLIKMAKRFDVDGGGHENACGCRIMPLDDGILVNRELNNFDIENNIKAWIEMWNTD
ncbi:MAG: hypothetical protein HOA28_03690 [Euryarchaeota archaeon]|nr:hypothetical protein [Euryarchaeota archaeon]